MSNPSYGQAVPLVINHPDPFSVDSRSPSEIPGYHLIWNDEFNDDGDPLSENWDFEHGFVRNMELQWYQSDNAQCENGRLVITGKSDKIENPAYDPDKSDWRLIRPFAEYSSACLITRNKQEWSSFGYFEIRARIDTTSGSWPAIWMLGKNQRWPFCGEIDIMEFYRRNGIPSILANVAWGAESGRSSEWDTSVKPIQEFLDDDPDWVRKYHIWAMEWNPEKISLYLDGKLLNETNLEETINPRGDNPFSENKKHYLLLNLAIGSNGGEPADELFPITFEVDYVRVYKVVE